MPELSYAKLRYTVKCLFWFISAPSNEHELEMTASSDEKQTLRHWLSKLRDLRGEVEKLRGMICNKYAEDMGENLNCTQQ